MQLVDNIDEILANIETLDKVRSSENQDLARKYVSLINLGTCFLPYLLDGHIAFAPSRFIGYRDNTFAKHAVNQSLDGRETNVALNIIFGRKPVPDKILEEQYRLFCAKLEIVPRLTGSFGAPRKYWIPQEIQDRLDRIAQDDVNADTSLSVTDKEQIIMARVGQGLFRDGLLKTWIGRCCLTGCDITPVLRASHIKPWRNSNNQERLDPFNGLLLTANMDALFDRGLISFSEDGVILRSRRISAEVLVALGCDPEDKLKFSAGHAPYIAYHRTKIFVPGR